MKSKPKGFFLKLSLAASALALTGAAVAAAWGWAWLGGPGFRRLAERSLGGLLQADVTLQPLTWNGIGSVRTGGCIARGYSKGPFERVEISEAEVIFTPKDLLAQKLNLAAIEIGKGRVVIGSSGRQGQQPSSPDAGKVSPGWLGLVAQLAAPRSVSLGPIRAAQADLEWPTPLGAGGLRGARVEVRQRGDLWEITARGGRLKAAPLLPTFDLVDAKVRAGDGRVSVTASELAGSGRGRLRVTGEVVPQIDLALNFDGFDLVGLLPKEHADKISGSIRGQVTLRGSHADGTVSLEGARLRGGAPMEKLARFTGRAEYLDLPLSKVQASFQSGSGAGQMEVRRLVVESNGALAVEGSFTTGNDRIDGVFELGLPPEVLRRLPGSATAVFKREERGYRWTQVRVSGPLASPENDLVRRLVLAPLEATAQGLGNVVGRTFDVGFELLGKGAGGLVDSSKAVGGAMVKGTGTLLEEAGNGVGAGTQFIREGVESALDLLPFGSRTSGDVLGPQNKADSKAEK